MSYLARSESRVRPAVLARRRPVDEPAVTRFCEPQALASGELGWPRVAMVDNDPTLILGAPDASAFGSTLKTRVDKALVPQPVIDGP